eukprot:jgi/Ulvmu1/5480/UM023_0016.1
MTASALPLQPRAHVRACMPRSGRRHARCVVALASGKEDNTDKMDGLAERIASGQYSQSGSKKERLTRPARKLLSKDRVGPGRFFAKKLADLGLEWSRRAAARMPAARGDLRELFGEPVFVPLYSLFRAYGPIFKLSFGPQTFVIISDPEMAKQMLKTNASKYSKGILSDILEFVMGTGLIPADGEVWKTRRRKVVPALHRRYIESMVQMFGDSAEHCAAVLAPAAASGSAANMENYYSRLGLDIIGKAVFNYDFDSLDTDDPVIRAVYTALSEAEHRSLVPIPYWKLPFATTLIPRQKRTKEALEVIRDTFDRLIAKSKAVWESEDEEFDEEVFLSQRDPSILHFLIASGDDITSQQLRDDLMTMLIAGHETTAAVLTWTTYLLTQHPEEQAKVQAEVDAVLGDGKPTMEQLTQLKYTTRVINEAMRLYPQPPVLIRRALEDDVLGGHRVAAGTDFFISVWNLHRSPALWDEPDAFRPMRFGPLTDKIPNEITTGFKYLPFGGGTRKCIGDQFALFESVVTLAMLQRRFTFHLHDSAGPIGMVSGATIHTSNGLPVRLEPRAVAGGAAGSAIAVAKPDASEPEAAPAAASV